MRAGLKRGFTPPRVTLEGRDASITAVTEATPEASLFYTPFKDMPGVRRASRRQLRARGRSASSAMSVQPAYAELLDVHAHRVRAGHAHHARGRGAARRQGVLPRQDPRIHHARHGSARRSTSWASPRSRACTARCSSAMHDTRLQGRLPGVPQVPAHRPALLREDARGAADARGLDRQALRRQGVAVLRLPAARALCHQAGAGRPGAVLHRRPRRSGRLPRSTPTTCRAGRSTTSRRSRCTSPRPGTPSRCRSRMEHKDQPELSPAHLHLRLRRGLGAVLRAAGS